MLAVVPRRLLGPYCCIYQLVAAKADKRSGSWFLRERLKKGSGSGHAREANVEGTSQFRAEEQESDEEEKVDS